MFLRLLTILLLVVGLLSAIIERRFVSGIDENGVVQESFFLPLSFIAGGLGLVLLVVLIVRGRGRG
ncbi:DUF3955 domain-containing protein [Oceanomicrobium pacificus]|uniref:DUF3955 domain-containing protein n=1 Tax=Oceanomicrobium pacificus TaxID=2692916 RepID=A0A6B0TII0_9RHOB|nr:DUF3955 domain-containing protein [Oceanomicrobium pacificus]MXU64230.1 DUF3955 domain-containing protein [Oceanomicrobium pacificus]